MASLEEVLGDFLEKVESVSTGISTEDRSRINKAEAKVFKSELEKVTHDKHYRNRKTGADPHLADSVLMQSNRNGTSSVGWDYSKSRQGHLIENGTKFPLYTVNGHMHKHAGQIAIRGDHFVRKTRQNKRVQKKMLQAGAAEYSQIVRERGDN